MGARFGGIKCTRIALAFSVGTLLGVLTITAPKVLADNTFLKNFATHEVLSLLIVVLTITFASVANIHLSISRTLLGAIKNHRARQAIEEEFARPLRSEINSSAWLLFWAFAICSLAVLAKGQFDSNVYVVSAVHAIVIVVMLVNAIVLYDIY